ncbi:hypothetical protein CLV51_1011488 [Chitinophaga niastensis]|uniref:Histidine kinase domain-containing protein n=1 Tax=Chitinophaga niastensis TaxID=536980 RepID=A0A2P8HVF2_CHINA|nr:HAMP domain-containing sensor histidine kinase [Chitinophaga niastensis]PSL50144.1 hypothetical protein CLV51_1011488 [Chitinophaga niastensis]
MIKTFSHIRYKHITTAFCAVVMFLCLAEKGMAQSPQLPELQQELTQQHDSTRYADVMGKMGALYLMINIDSSFWYAIKEEELAARLQYKAGMADAYDVMSFCYALKTDFSIANVYAYKALQLHKALSDSARISKTLSNIYLYYRNLGRPVEANNYFNEAFYMAARLPPSQDSMYSILLVNYAMRFYKDSIHRDSVQWALKKARHISEKYPRSRLIFYIDAYAADELAKHGHGKEAEAKINMLADNALKRGLPYVAMDMYNRLEAYLQQGYFIDSTRYRALSYELAKKAGCIELNLSTLAGLYDYYSQKKDLSKISYYSNEIMRLAAQSRYQQGSGPINYINYFLKERALQQITQRNFDQQQKLEKERVIRRHNKFIMAGIFTIVILLIALVFSRYRQYITSQQQEALLSKKYKDISLKNVTLRANDEFKNKLIAIIANDFRAPLQYIVEVAVHLKNNEMDQAVVAGLLKEIAGASGRTLTVFDNILKWIRLQLSGFVYRPAPCQLQNAMQTALQPLQPVIVQKKLEVVNKIPPDVEVSADVEMLRLVNLQLLQVAVNYAVGSSLLAIISWKENTTVYVQVIADTGGEVSAIVKSLSDWQQDMYALGYAIARDFIDKMNGEISVGESEGRYLTLTYTLKVISS